MTRCSQCQIANEARQRKKLTLLANCPHHQSQPADRPSPQLLTLKGWANAAAVGTGLPVEAGQVCRPAPAGKKILCCRKTVVVEPFAIRGRDVEVQVSNT